MTHTAGPRKRVSRAERGRQILDAAVAVFADRGYHAASMDAVAQLVGVTKPVLYDHFGSKDGLLRGCIARAREELLAVTTRAASTASTPEEMLRLGFRAFFDYLDAHEPTWTLLYQEGAVPAGDGADSLEGIRAQQTEFMSSLLAAHAPDASRQRVEAWAQVMVGACERLALWRRDNGVTSEQATEYLMDLVWTGMAGQRH